MKKISAVLSLIYQDIFRIRIALFILLLYCVITQTVFHTVCPFAILTGFPCPGCGLTRAALLLLTGHFRLAAGYHLAIYLWLPLLLYLMVFRYFFGKKPPFSMGLTVLVSLATLMYYVIRLCAETLPPVPCQGILHIAYCCKCLLMIQ